ncbi:hypothetical protein O988_07643 [Pseudogymnoascus sp. VKM F-3808]|nr:hypothetical protein V490_08570 [Pseudogymnoascus sp. VKM F-3557]KFX91650.1 hypothetical protein O988_07643 [Pseudogymnoascus sp. VKM F-3808]KFY48214.1 hypothetical protein V495_01517 [Pseudogymnoascus sp. VKM F-4514 (FW-929)]KFY51695.1 hypothetical protein V497_08929 [Pseudogymnoascus sp. VKM F-4516 (FW-969)]
MSSSRYERVAAADDDYLPTPTTPNSPPPSFRSHESSPTRNRSSSHPAIADQNLADAFDADGSDSDDDNDGDDRQRLMRGTPTDSSSAHETPAESESDAQSRTDGAIQLADTRPTHTPVFAPTVQGRVYGGGSGSDGVFANLSAKPERGEKIEEHPPTYEQAAADAAPPYWETTIVAPGSYDPNEVYIDGLAVGSFFSFAWNGMISMSFQLVGFLLTYLLHTTHAAKNGSRAGLGVTLIQYGFYMKGTTDGDAAVPGDSSGDAPQNPDSHDFEAGEGGLNGYDWAAYVLMVVGWFILIRAISDFLRARRHEQLVLQSPDRGLGTAVVAEGESPSTAV